MAYECYAKVVSEAYGWVLGDSTNRDYLNWITCGQLLLQPPFGQRSTNAYEASNYLGLVVSLGCPCVGLFLPNNGTPASVSVTAVLLNDGREHARLRMDDAAQAMLPYPSSDVDGPAMLLEFYGTLMASTALLPGITSAAGRIFDEVANAPARLAAGLRALGVRVGGTPGAKR